MTYKQYQRWWGFSLRMARRGYADLTPARREKLVNEVIGFFDEFGVAHEHWQIITHWCMPFKVDGYSYCLTDEVCNAFEQYMTQRMTKNEDWGKFHTQATCCIRAGFEAAVKPDGGVVGFDVGDIRRMYPRGLPGWLCHGYPGIEQQPDNMGIWI